MFFSGSINTYWYSFHHCNEKKEESLLSYFKSHKHRVPDPLSHLFIKYVFAFFFFFLKTNLQLVLAQILVFKRLNFFTLQKAKGVLVKVNFQPVKKLFPLFHSQQTLNIAESPRGTKNTVNKVSFTPLYLIDTHLAILCTSTASEKLLHWEGQRDRQEIPCFGTWWLPRYSKQ